MNELKQKVDGKEEISPSNIMGKAGKSLPIIAAAIFLTFPIALGLANTLMVILLGAWIMGGNYKNHWHAIRGNPITVSALILYGVIIFGILYTSALPKDVSLHLSKYSKLLLVPILFCALSQPEWQRRCLTAFTISMTFILASTWLNIWFLLPWSASQELGWGASHHVFGDYITQNVMMAFFVLLCLTSARLEAHPFKRFLWLAAAILGGISITHLSQGRTGYVLLLMSLLVFVFSLLRGRTRWITLAVTVALLGAAASSSQLIERRFNRLVVEMEQHDIDNSTSIGHRLYNYKTTVQLSRDNPIFGVGTGAYHTEICDYIVEKDKCINFSWHPHNQFLFFGADHGVLGILAYAALILSMLVLAMKDPNPKSRTLLFGLAYLILIDSLINSPLWSARESHFFLFMAGLLAAMSGANLRSKHMPPEKLAASN